MELQWLGNGWDSLGMLYGVCWNWLQAKRTSGLWFGLWFADPALFWQKMGFLVYKGVWEVASSCFWLSIMCSSWFKCSQALVLSDCKDMDFWHNDLVLKQKVILTMQRLVQSSLGSAHSWYTFPYLCGCGFLQKIKSNAQDKQKCKSCALCKWHCCLFAKNGLIQCVIF